MTLMRAFWRRTKPVHVCPTTPGIEVRVSIADIDNGAIMQATSEHLAFIHTYGGNVGEWQEFVPTMSGMGHGVIIAPGTHLIYEYRRVG